MVNGWGTEQNHTLQPTVHSIIHRNGGSPERFPVPFCRCLNEKSVPLVGRRDCDRTKCDVVGRQ